MESSIQPVVEAEISGKRLYRTAEEKRRVVEATLWKMKSVSVAAWNERDQSRCAWRRCAVGQSKFAWRKEA